MSYLDERREHINKGRPKAEKKKHWLKPVAEKRKSQNEEYKILRLKFLKDHPRCECGRPGCVRISVEVHHSGGRIGADFLDTVKWKAISRVCHRWAEENPLEAKKLGLSVSRLNK
jgi:hypothetical protein